MSNVRRPRQNLRILDLSIVSRLPQPRRLAATLLSAVTVISTALLMGGPAAFGDTINWTTGPGTANWNVAGNWTGTNTPPLSGDILVFDTTTGVTTLNNNLTSAAFNVGGLTFTATAPAYTIAGNAFTLTGDITNNGVALQTINDAIALAGISTITTTTGGGNVRLGGALSGATGSLVIAGPGTVTLTGNNTFGGGTTVNGGILALGTDSGGNQNANALGSGAVTVNSGAQLRLGGTGGGVTTLNLANNLTVNDATIFSVDGAQHLQGTLNVSTGTTTLLTKWGGKDLFLDGVVSGSAALAIDSTNDGNGGASVYFNNGANTYAGTITVNASSSALGRSGGILVVGNNTALASATINSLRGTGVRFAAGVTAPVFAALTGNSGFTLQDQSAAPVAVALSIGGNNASTAFSGALSGAGSFTKNGTGTLTLSAASTYSGGTTINGGTIQVGNGSNQSATTLGTGLVTVNSATLTLGNISGGAGITNFANSFSINGGTITANEGNNRLATGVGATFNIASGGGSIAGAYQDKPLEIVGALTGTGNLTIFHTGQSTGHSWDGSIIRLSNAGDASVNTYTGTITVTPNVAGAQLAGNYLFLAQQSVLANATVNLIGNNSGGALVRGTSTMVFAAGNTAVSLGALAGSGNLALADQTAVPLPVALTVGGGSTNASSTYSGVLSGAGSLTKAGTGTFALAGANTYAGGTTVNGGTLLVGGSIAGNTTVNNAGSTLGGTGTVGSVTVGSGAALQGGDGVSASGALKSAGTVSLTDGSVIKLTLGASAAHSSLTRTGGTWSFDLDQAFTFNSGAAAGFYNNILSGLTGSEIGLASINTWLITNPEYAGSSFSYDNSGGVDLTLVVVPEPGALLSLLGGLGFMLGLRRFRRRLC